MSPGIVVPLIVLPIVIVGVFVWYRRSMSDMAADDLKPISGLRLTAEALHRSPSPPWRVVYEIGGALGAVDHVVIGPAGVIAITTVVADRPDPSNLREEHSDAQLVSDAAIARGPIDELLRAVDASCNQTAKVFWGTPAPRRPAVDELVHGSQLVEGQRIEDWLTQVDTQATARLDPARVDEIWRTIVVGIGRPDPLP